MRRLMRVLRFLELVADSESALGVCPLAETSLRIVDGTVQNAHHGVERRDSKRLNWVPTAVTVASRAVTFKRAQNVM